MRMNELYDIALDHWLASAIMAAVTIASCLCTQRGPCWPQLGKQRKLRHAGRCLGERKGRPQSTCSGH